MPYDSLKKIDLHLWPHQVQFVDDIQRVEAGCLNPIGTMATGGGKTRAIVEDVRRTLMGGQFSTIGICCHSVDVLRQLLVDNDGKPGPLTELRIPYGWVAAGEQENQLAPIQLISTATLLRRHDSLKYSHLMKRLQSKGTKLIFDEVHRSLSGKVGELVWTWDAFVSGYTATPWNKTLPLRFDEIVPGPIPSVLQAMGYLVYSRVIEPPDTVSADGLPVQAGDFSSGAVSKLMRENPGVTKRIVRFIRSVIPHGKVLYFVADKLHAAHVGAALDEIGVPNEVILADTEGRAEALGRIRRSVDTSGISIDVLSTGIDIPDLRSIVFLRHTMSPIVFYQQWGRGLRTAPGKEYCWIFDVVGNIERMRGMGFPPPEDLDEYLFEGTRKKGTREIGQKTCPECGTLNGSMRLRCVECAYLFEETCPQCKADLFFNQNTCRRCGYDKRTVEERLAAEKEAAARLEELRRSFEENFLFDSTEEISYTYSRLCHEAWAGRKAMDEPLRWLKSILRGGTALELLAPYTLHTLWTAEQVAGATEACFREYAERLLQYRYRNGGMIPGTDVTLLMGLQFGHQGRQFLTENYTTFDRKTGGSLWYLRRRK